MKTFEFKRTTSSSGDLDIWHGCIEAETKQEAIELLKSGNSEIDWVFCKTKESGDIVDEEIELDGEVIIPFDDPEPVTPPQGNDITPEWLIAKMKEHNIKSIDFAKTLGTSTNTISRWRTGAHEIQPIAKTAISFYFTIIENQ